MVKVRPAIVVSPRLPYRSEIVTVVPISTTAPHHELPFVVKLSKNYHPLEADALNCWAKCDMIMNIARWRLEGFKVGRRKWSILRQLAMIFRPSGMACCMAWAWITCLTAMNRLYRSCIPVFGL